MIKHKTLGLLVIAAAPLLAAVAAAQPRGGGGGVPIFPLGAALDKVPVGTWAEYDLKREGEPPRKMRHALVARGAEGVVIESRGENARGDRTLTQVTVSGDPTVEGAIKKVVSQVADLDPMEMPTGPPPGTAPGAAGGEGPGGRGRGMGMRVRFLKPDPKALVGKETLKLAGASFATEHYRQPGPRGGTIDFWLAKDAGPFGLVKMEFERPDRDGPGGDRPGGKTIIELAAKGKGAKPEITKPAKPFDPEALRARYGGRDRDGAREGGPPQ